MKLPFTTPPWTREGNSIVGGRYVCDLADWGIVEGGAYTKTNQSLEKERDANASLLKSAPDLLEAVSLYLYAANIGSDALCGEAYWFMRDAYRLATERTVSEVGLKDVIGVKAQASISNLLH